MSGLIVEGDKLLSQLNVMKTCYQEASSPANVSLEPHIAWSTAMLPLVVQAGSPSYPAMAL